MPRQYQSRFGPPTIDDSSFAATLVAPQPDRPRLATIHRQPTVVNVVFDEAMPSFFAGSQPSRPRLGRLDHSGLSLSQTTHVIADPAFPEFWTGSHPDRPRLFKALQLPQPPTQATPVDISTGPEQWRGYHPDSPTKFGRGRQIGLPPEWVFVPEPFSIDMIVMNRPLRPVLFRARYSRVVVQPPWPNAIVGPVCLTTAVGLSTTLDSDQALAPSPTVTLSVTNLAVTLFKC